MRNYEVV